MPTRRAAEGTAQHERGPARAGAPPGRARAHTARGEAPGADAAVLYGAAAVLAYALLRRPGVRWLSTAARAVAALVPYTALKTAWALGATPGYTGAGRPGADPEYTSDLGIWLYDHGVDVTVVLALVGMALALALTRPWGRRLPRLPLLALGWAGAGALAPFGAFLAAFGVLAWTGVISVGMADHAPWVVAVAYGGFCGYGLALGRATRVYQRATRTTCVRC